MNNRDYKQFTSGNYYHIYNRGNGKIDIFKDDQDFQNFLKRLFLVLNIELPLRMVTIRHRKLEIIGFSKDAFDVACYCLMPNHFHFLIRQNTEVSIGNLINKVCSSYGKYFNKKYAHVGTLYQDSFKAVLVESNTYLLWLSAYIHQNPKVAGLVIEAEDYPWSSYGEYLKMSQESFCKKSIIIKQFNSIDKYKHFVDTSYELIKNNKDKDLFLD